MPLVRVVFPVPRSPVRRTRTGGLRRFANSLPQWVVSSEECVMISSGTLSQLRNEATVGFREMLRDFTGEERGLRARCGGIVGGQAVQIDAEREGPFPICGAKLRRHASENSRQHVSAAALGHAGISGRIDEGPPIRRGENRMKTF